jgi:hypothetical protein
MRSFTAILVLAVLTGCANVHHVPPKQFQIEANLMQSLQWTEYIGQADGKAYLLRKSAPLFGRKWTEEILFTEVGALSPEFLRQLQKAKEDRASNHGSEDSARTPADPRR